MPSGYPSPSLNWRKIRRSPGCPSSKIEDVGHLPRRIVVVHDVAIGAERWAIGHSIAAVHRMPAKVIVDPVEGAAIAPLPIVHRARPEAALPIELAVVEAVAGTVRLGVEENLEAPCLGIDLGDAVLGPADEPAALARRERSHADRRWPFGDLPRSSSRKIFSPLMSTQYSAPSRPPRPVPRQGRHERRRRIADDSMGTHAWR